MNVRCLRCGAPVTGLTQFCDDCAKLQERPPFSSHAPSPGGGEMAAGQPPSRLPYETSPFQAPAVCRRCGNALTFDGPSCPACGEPVLGAGEDYAGFWMRFLASIVDGIIVGLINLPIAFLVDSLVISALLQGAVNAIYTIGFWVTRAATPGKMAMGLSVIMANGQPITGGAAVLRWIGYYVNALTLGIGYLMIAFTAQKRGLHDYIAGTIVVRKS